ncbi:MAG: HEAT repeat domain-containing protein [Caldilineaceae bacterium]
MHLPDHSNLETPEQILSRLYDIPYRRAWWQAIEHLAWFGGAAVPNLIEALRANSVPVRRVAAQALGRIGPTARPATRILLDCLFDNAYEVRFDAAWALARIAPSLKAALPLLIGRLAAEENRSVQVHLLRILGNIGPAAQPALALIYPKLDDPYLFRDALYALRAIDPTDDQFLQALYCQLTTVDAPFQALAAEMVGKMRLNSPEWVNSLITATKSRHAKTRHAARNALAKIHSVKPERVQPHQQSV